MEAHRVNLRCARVLLIEDNYGDVLLTKLAFKRADFDSEITVAETAEKGLKILRQEGEYSEVANPDIILLDLNLSGMNGWEFLNIVKSDNQFRHLPIIVLSSSRAESDIRKCFAQFANGYFTKPMANDRYAEFVKQIESYWISLMELPAYVMPAQLF